MQGNDSIVSSRPDFKVNRSITSPQTLINTGFLKRQNKRKCPDYNFTTTFFGAKGSNIAQ